MNIYDIDYEIEQICRDAVDPETGEISPEARERLDALQMERTEKIENVGLWYKNTLAESKAIAEEIKNLTARKKTLDNFVEWQKRYLSYALDGEKFSTAKVAISFRKSETVEIDDVDRFCTANQDNDMLVTTSVERRPNKTALKQYLKDGWIIDGVHLEEHQNIQIK